MPRATSSAGARATGQRITSEQWKNINKTKNKDVTELKTVASNFCSIISHV